MEDLLLFSPSMRTRSSFILLLSLLTLLVLSITTSAQQLRDAFRKVNQTIVIVRTKRLELAPSANQALSIIGGLGSGVLILFV